MEMKMKKLTTIFIAIVMFLLNVTISSSYSGVATGEQINWQVLSSGGGKGTSTNFMINGTLSQTSVGTGLSTNFVLGHGFWQAFGGGIPGCCLVRGDVATPIDGNVLVNDLVFMVNYLFKGGASPDCLDAGDVATPLDGNILVNDLVFLVNYLFKGGQLLHPAKILIQNLRQTLTIVFVSFLVKEFQILLTLKK